MFYAASSASSVVTPLRDLMYPTDHLHQVNFTIEINFPDYFLIESTTPRSSRRAVLAPIILGTIFSYSFA